MNRFKGKVGEHRAAILELAGVVADVEDGNGFDDISLETIKRVQRDIQEMCDEYAALESELEAALQQQGEAVVSDVVFNALTRFVETTEDEGTTDLPLTMLDGLVAFGYLSKRRGGRHGNVYGITELGEAALEVKS